MQRLSTRLCTTTARLCTTPARLCMLLAPLFLAALGGCGSTEGLPLAPTPLAEEAIATAHTTRLPGGDPAETAIAITQAVYPATREENAVGAIILTPPDPTYAYMAMHRVTHMPVNAPLLYLEADGTLSEQTLVEMGRLRPDGVMPDERKQVYLLGPHDPSVLRRIEQDLHYEVRVFEQTDPVLLADELDRWQAAMKADWPDEVVISALDHPDGIAHGIGAMGWNAHMGKGFAWVYRDRVPEATRRLLDRRIDTSFIYLTGDEAVISDEVAVELGEYGLVRRIAGDTPVASNVVNAGYKDYGRNFGWWLDDSPRGFGWGIAQSGHNYIIGSKDDLLSMIPAAVLGHMGKHGPILLVERDRVPEEVREYLEMVRPTPADSRVTVLNHAWIIGGLDRVSWEVQREIDLLLRPSPPPETLTGLEVEAP